MPHSNILRRMDMTLSALDKKIRPVMIGWIALFLAFFHVISGVWGTPITLAFRYIHLTFMLVLVLMYRPLKASQKHSWLNVIDYVLGLGAIAVLVYILSDLTAFANREGACTQTDIIMGTIYLIVVLEVTRRVTGPIMIVLALFFSLQNVFAAYLPGFLHTAPVSYTRLIDYLFMRTSGIIGSALSCMCNYVIFFMIFAAILEDTGAGDFFIKLALAIVGKTRGGPAKVAVVSSALFGSLSGSAIANVASTGAITIPLMKKNGYDPEFAGAVEAVASTGGQIMPPMMGAAAFIMAETLGMPYIGLAAAALIPAVMYFISVYFMVDFKATKMDLKRATDDEIPPLGQTLREGWMYLLPLVVIVALLVMGRSALSSAIWSTALLIAIAIFSPSIKMDGRKMVNSICKGVVQTSGVSATAATAGIIVGGIMISGLGLKLTQMVITVSGGLLPVALLLTAVVSIILGMGMTTTAVYVTVATVIAPSLSEFGVPDLSAHMFCFYFGCICTITPPVALAAYTAAGISGSSPSKTGWRSFIIGIASYIIPFLFVYKPSLLLIGTPISIIWDTVVTLMAVYCLAALVQGCMKVKITKFEAVLMIVLILCAFWTNRIADIIAFALFLALLLMQTRRKKVEVGL